LPDLSLTITELTRVSFLAHSRTFDLASLISAFKGKADMVATSTDAAFDPERTLSDLHGSEQKYPVW
jgi:hypothetical protein